MTTARTRSPRICKLLQPLTQNGVISPGDAKNIIVEFIRGNNEPVKKLAMSRDIPTSMLPIIEELKKEAQI